MQLLLFLDHVVGARRRRSQLLTQQQLLVWVVMKGWAVKIQAELQFDLDFEAMKGVEEQVVSQHGVPGMFDEEHLRGGLALQKCFDFLARISVVGEAIRLVGMAERMHWEKQENLGVGEEFHHAILDDLEGEDEEGKTSDPLESLVVGAEEEESIHSELGNQVEEEGEEGE